MAYLNVFINNSNKNPINVNRDTKPVPPGPGIDKWVKEHMVFWHDMSKPVDVYAENFNDWTKYPVNADVAITSTTFTITRFVAENDVVKCYIPSKTKNFPGMKVEVKGIVDGQELYWGYSADVKLVNITQDGTYDIPPLGTVRGNLSFRNGNIVGACNITITQLPSGQSVPTNEILKANPYLQDFSGNNRPLKLNNFLFAAMSGVGGYEINWADTTIWANFLGSRFEGKIESSKLTITSALVPSGIMETKVPSFSIGYKVRVTGITDESLIYSYTDEAGQSLAISIAKDGEYELPSNNVVEATYNMRWRVVAASYPHTCNITIEQIPSCPNALITDGVDDYGVVENLQQGVKVLFYTCNPFSLNKMFYDQRKTTSATEAFFSIYNSNSKIAYNDRNTGGVTYIDGTINNLLLASNLLNVKHTITIVNDGATESNTISPIYFSKNQHDSYFANLAFYNSIGFDSVPTKETDGFTEQDLIDYVLENLITQ